MVMSASRFFDWKRASAMLLLSLTLALAGCAATQPTWPRVPSLVVQGTDGRSHAIVEEIASAPVTVFVFFSESCGCLDAHALRLHALHDAYERRGVRFFFVDPEVGASVERDAELARRRSYAFPILLDPGGRFASAAGAEYATYALVVDPSGHVRYRGGIDTDKTRLHDDATPMLRDALDDVLAGREPRRPEGKALGCALRFW
jgi:hypothetical protein